MTIRFPVWHRCDPLCGAQYPQHVLRTWHGLTDWLEEGRATKAQADKSVTTPHVGKSTTIGEASVDLAPGPHLLTPFLLSTLCDMFTFLRSSGAGLSSDPPGVAHTENDKDLVNPAGVIARPGSDSNANPGGLTFEEGGSCLMIFSASQLFADKLLIADTAGGMGRHFGVFSCTMLMYPSF